MLTKIKKGGSGFGERYWDRDPTSPGGFNREFAENNEDFIEACAAAGCEPTARQASKFRRGMGAAAQALKVENQDKQHSADARKLLVSKPFRRLLRRTTAYDNSAKKGGEKFAKSTTRPGSMRK